MRARPAPARSTLVASYLEARRLRHLWYQRDVGDADTATFVHYLRIARSSSSASRRRRCRYFTLEAAAEPGALHPRLLPRPLLGRCPIRASSSSTTSTSPTRCPSSARRLRKGSRRCPTGSRSSSSRAPIRQPSSRGSSRAGASRASTKRSSAARRRKRKRILGGQPVDREQLARIQRQSDGWVAALVLSARALTPAWGDAGRIAGRGQGRDLPVLRRRDLQRRASGEPARADAERDSAVDHRFGSRRAHRQRGSAAPARVPVSPPPVHRPAPRRAG